MNDAYAFIINRDVFPAARFTTVGDLATDIVTILVYVSGLLSLVFIIMSGIKYATSSGDQKKLASASSTIMYAIIGLVVTILAFVILQVVQFFLRSNVPIS